MGGELLIVYEDAHTVADPDAVLKVGTARLIPRNSGHAFRMFNDQHHRWQLLQPFEEGRACSAGFIGALLYASRLPLLCFQRAVCGRRTRSRSE